MDEHIHDLVIVGGGPAGLSAGIYAKRAALDVVLVEKGMPGGQIALTQDVENYPGIEEIGGFVDIGGEAIWRMAQEAI